MAIIQGIPVTDAMPRCGWLPRYVAQARRLTDAHGIYHIACGLGILSALACQDTFAAYGSGRDVRVEPLHLWTLLMGPSANHKGTALLRSLELVTDVLGKRYRSPTGSRQGIEDVLAKCAHPIWIMEEAPEWFQMNRGACMRGGAAFWCNLYDGRVRPRNLAGGNDDSKPSNGDEATVSRSVFFAAGSTDGMLIYTKPIDWTGGLLSRMLIVKAGDPDKPKPIGYTWQPEVIRDLTDRLELCSLALPSSRMIRADRHAFELFVGWSNDLTAKLRGLQRTHDLLGRRLGNHCMRAAALFAISRRSRVITADDVLPATRLCDYSLKSIRSIDIK